MKILRNISIILLVLGLVMVIGGAVSGGHLYASIWDGDIHTIEETHNYIGYADSWDSVEEAWENRQGSGRFHQKGEDSKPVNGRYETISLDLGAGEYTIAPTVADTPSVETAGALPGYSETTEGSDWSLEIPRADEPVTIYLPENGFSYLELEIGAGTVAAYGLHCLTLDLDLGAGAADLQNMTIETEADIDVGVGDLALGLTGNAQDYALRAEVGAGELRLNGKTIASGVDVYNENGGVGIPLSVEVGMGRAAITTAE